MIGLIGALRMEGLGGPPEVAAEQVAEGLRALWGQLPRPIAPERLGLWVATEDVGAEASRGLWSSALTVGPAFASPQLFPWTLASSLGGHVARRLNLRGPNTTLVGGAEASAAALFFAMSTILDNDIDFALVLRARAVGGRVDALALCAGAGRPLALQDAPGPEGAEDPISALLEESGSTGSLARSIAPWGTLILEEATIQLEEGAPCA